MAAKVGFLGRGLIPLIGEREEVNTNFITRTDLSRTTKYRHSSPVYKKYVPATIIPLIILLLPDVIPTTMQHAI